ncbi:MAG TPA: SusC/RagA family TonB-linked outer membrane protein [Dysgonamonadaceae bacterium]|nr:SusC/RagA family TonB-linked outer membrane protein [Dysgonamonadaceae bacterium]
MMKLKSKMLKLKVLVVTFFIGFGISGQISAQQRVVNGTVTDIENLPLAGVTVMVKGSALGTITDVNGEYSISGLPDNGVLVFSFIGMKTQEVNSSNRTIINVLMEEESIGIDEVVVTALGIRKDAKALAYSVTKLEGDQFAKIKNDNFANSLTGLVAGVNVSGVGSGMGGSSRVTIRGNTSIAGDNQPLYIINGLPMDNTRFGEAGGGPDWGDNISSINSDDIEELTVLKGATAAALYGSRAKNGAIIITTKSGKKQEGIGIDFNSSMTMETPYYLWELQDEYGQGYGNVRPQSVQDAANHSQNHWGEPYDGVPTIQYDGVVRPYSYVKDKVLDDFYRNGHTLSNNVSFSGGGDNGTFRIGLGDYRTKFIIPNSSLNRNNISLDIDQKLTDKISISANVNYIKEDANNRYIYGSRSGTAGPILFLSSNMPTSALSPGYDENFKEKVSGTDLNATNPYFAANRLRNESDKDRFITSVNARWDILDWLFIRGKAGQDYFTFKSALIVPDGTGHTPRGKVEDRGINSWERNFELLMGMEKNLNQDFNFTANLGGNMMSQYSRSTSIEGLGFIIPQLHVVNNTSTRNTSTGISERKTNSIFGTAELSYRNFLYLNATGRNDWFSTLNPKSNSYFYPSAGLSFVFSELFNLPKTIDFGKVRVAYASVGGDTSPYQLNLTYGVLPYSYDGRPLGTINQNIVPNINLRPLSVNEFEVGLDMRFFNNRLGFDMAYYNKLTTNDIARETISETSGYTGVTVNVGELRNRGVELLLRGTPIKTRDFSWDISANMAYNKNTVLKISNETKELVLEAAGRSSIKLIEGEDYSMITGRTILRNEDGQEVMDATGLPIVTNDIVNFGSGVHKYTAGLTNSINYKNLSLSFLIDGKFGAKIYSETAYGLDHRGMSPESLLGRKDGVVLPGVTESGEVNTVLVSAERAGNRAITVRRRAAVDDYLYDASFIKLRNMAITYQVPTRIVQKSNFIQGASISLIGNDLKLLMNRAKNIDPDTNFTAGNAQGKEDDQLPPTRSFGLNINLKF